MLRVWFDASCVGGSPGVIGWAVVFERSGRIVRWRAGNSGYGDIKLGESQAGIEALKLAQSQLEPAQLHGLQVTGDSLEIIRSLRERQRQLQRGGLTERNRDHYWAMSQARIEWESREHNLAHQLALAASGWPAKEVREGSGEPDLEAA